MVILMEQSVHLTPITIIGTLQPKDNSFSKTFLYRPPDATLHACRGELYACLSLASPDPSLDLENLSNQILTCLSDNYFSKKEGSPLEALSQAASSAQERALELTRREGGQIPLDFSFVCTAVWGKAAFVSLGGGGYVGVFRGSELIPETENRLFSEELKDKDILLLATPLFVARIGEERIAEILRDSLKEEWTEKFKEIVSQKEEQSRLAAILLKVEIEKVPGEEETVEILEVPKQEQIYTPLLHTLQNILAKLQIHKLGNVILNVVKNPVETTKSIGLPARFAKSGRAGEAGILPRFARWGDKLRKALFGVTKILPFPHLKREPEVYLKEQKPSNRGKKVALVGALIVFLIVSVLGTQWWNKRTERKKEINSLLSKAEEKISESQKAITTSPERAKKLLAEASDSLGKVKGMQTSQKDIEVLETKMGEILEKAYNTEKVETTLIADLGLKIEGASFKELVKLGEKLYSLDVVGGKFAEVDLENENEIEVLSTSNQPTSQPANQFLAGYLDFLYIFDPKRGIIEINRRTSGAEVVIPTDFNWKAVSGLETYMGNLYLLDPPGNQILKYIAVDTGFSKMFTYFTQNVNLSQVKSFTIDGAIFLLYSDGRLEKYLGGAREDFALSGLYPPLSDVSQIYTNPDSEKLYLVSGNSFLIFNKNGTYEKRLQLEGVGQIEDLVVAENEGKIWVLAADKVYQTR